MGPSKGETWEGWRHFLKKRTFKFSPQIWNWVAKGQAGEEEDVFIYGKDIG